MSTVKVRTRFQPTAEIDVDEEEAAALKHQGLLWAGTDAQLAQLHAEAELGPIAAAAGAAAVAAGVKTTAGTTVTATEKKEGAAS